MSTATEILCVEIVHADGARVFEPWRDYQRNPEKGTYAVFDRRRTPEDLLSSLGLSPANRLVAFTVGDEIGVAPMEALR